MVGWLMYDELKKTWKRRVVAYLSYLSYLSYFPSICPEGLKIHMPWVFDTCPAGLYHAAGDHIYELCMYYKNDTIV